MRGKAEINNLQAKLSKYRNITLVIFLILMFLYRYPNIWSLIAGFAIACSGELLRLWAVSYAGLRGSNEAKGNAEEIYLVISGPFAHMRNPLHTGNILLYTGMGIMSFAMFPLLQIVIFVFFFIHYRHLAIEEEEKLSKTFGKDYEDYRNSVPRFFPKLSSYRNSNIPQPSYNFSSGLRSELRTIQAFGLVTVTLILIWFIGRY